MARSLRLLPALLRDVDVVLEARDARLPLTSVNPVWEEAVATAWGADYAGAGGVGVGGWQRGRKRKLVVYTKRDLAERRFEKVCPVWVIVWWYAVSLIRCLKFD
jgi:hypothetical protein